MICNFGYAQTPFVFDEQKTNEIGGLCLFPRVNNKKKVYDFIKSLTDEILYTDEYGEFEYSEDENEEEHYEEFDENKVFEPALNYLYTSHEPFLQRILFSDGYVKNHRDSILYKVYWCLRMIRVYKANKRNKV